LAQKVEVRFPSRSSEAHLHGVRQRPIEGVTPGDPEQRDRSVVDEVRKLLQLIVEQAVAGVEFELALDFGNGGQVAEDDLGHDE
jgi:hypothetical protein